jgi:hypothetical protein
MEVVNSEARCHFQPKGCGSTFYRVRTKTSTFGPLLSFEAGAEWPYLTAQRPTAPCHPILSG